MASEEQLAVSEQVKKVHLWLRTRAQQVGPEQAWKEHLERKDVLQGYASAMKNLAEKYWAKNNQDERKSYCRIEWVRKVLLDYFSNYLREKLILKENTRLKLNEVIKPIEGKIKLLDVGSCYNPFKVFEFCETYAIDLCPAASDVKKCDFLDIQVSNQSIWYTDHVKLIPGCFFDVVVFCLFLEYLPGADQRLRACKTAFEILKNDGLLLIITPDSNHSTANSSLMKSWKVALSQIGFIRFRIEKLKYLYCMAFRKTQFPEAYQNSEKIPDILIPQDFVDYREKEKCDNSSSDNYDCSMDIFPNDFLINE